MKLKLNKRKNINIIYDDNIKIISNWFLRLIYSTTKIKMSNVRKIKRQAFSSISYWYTMTGYNVAGGYGARTKDKHGFIISKELYYKYHNYEIKT